VNDANDVPGHTNSGAPATALRLLVTDGGLDGGPLDEQAFTVAARLRCAAAGAGCGGGSSQVGDYALRLEAGGSAVEVEMGEEAELQAELFGASTRFRVHNLRSYESGLCDDYRNWAYWVQRVE
jgi:hypothetical protein